MSPKTQRWLVVEPEFETRHILPPSTMIPKYRDNPEKVAH